MFLNSSNVLGQKFKVQVNKKCRNILMLKLLDIFFFYLYTLKVKLI